MAYEQRVSLRQSLRTPVAYWGSHIEGGGTIANISTSGALIEPASRSVTPGTPLRIFVNEVDFSSVEISAEVVRTTEWGFAVSFTGVSPETERLLHELLE